MKIGLMELLVVFIVALVVIGPDKLPLYARKLGDALRQFRAASDELTRDIKESVIEPLEEAQQPLREAIEPLEELDASVRANMKDVTRSFNDLGKTKPKAKPQPAPEPAQKPEAPPEPEPGPEPKPEQLPAPPLSQPETEGEKPKSSEENGGETL